MDAADEAVCKEENESDEGKEPVVTKINGPEKISGDKIFYWFYLGYREVPIVAEEDVKAEICVPLITDDDVPVTVTGLKNALGIKQKKMFLFNPGIFFL